MGRKPRSDSKLDNLPESRVLELRDRLMRNERYEDVLDWLAVECGVSSSLASLSVFYRRHCAPLKRERRQLAAVKAEAILEDEGTTDWNAATLEKLKQLTFEFLDQPDVPMEEAERFVRLVLKARDQDLERDKFEEALRQARRAEETKKDLEKRKAEGGLSDETLELIERTLGML